MTGEQALLRAIHQQLTADAVLMSALGEAGVRDRVLPRMHLPAVIHGDIETRDHSTATEAGEEHLVTIEVWADGEGRAKAQELAGRIRDLLHDAPLALIGRHLVSLRFASTTSRRDRQTKLSLVELRFRAVTE